MGSQSLSRPSRRSAACSHAHSRSVSKYRVVPLYRCAAGCMVMCRRLLSIRPRVPSLRTHGRRLTSYDLFVATRWCVCPHSPIACVARRALMDWAVATRLPRTGGICRRTAASAGTLLCLLFASHCRLSALCKPCIARCSPRAVPIGRTQGSHAWGSAHLTPAPFANNVLCPLNEMNLGMHHQTLSSTLRSSLLMIANFWDPSLRTYEHLMALTVSLEGRLGLRVVGLPLAG